MLTKTYVLYNELFNILIVNKFNFDKINFYLIFLHICIKLKIEFSLKYYCKL